MTHTEPEKIVIRWTTKDENAIAAIRKRFNMPSYTTLNGWSPVEVKPEDKDIFEECARRGFFGIMPQKWCKNFRYGSRGGYFVNLTLKPGRWMVRPGFG